MASPYSAILCSALAIVLWMVAGWVIARRLPLGRDLAIAVAPILGWSVQTVIALQVSLIAGFTPVTVIASTIIILVALIGGGAPPPRTAGPVLPVWAFALATLVAVAPALSVLPKITPDGVALAGPIYDHAKIALIDEIVRTGVPPANPFFGQAGEAGTIAYYYLWHFGVAELALISGATGWEADIATTWFTAFASLVLMCGLAFRLSGGRTLSIVFVFAAALGGSLRPVLASLFGSDTVDGALKPASGLAGWLFQSSWSPQHMMSAAAVVLSLVLIERLSRRPSIGLAIVLALAVAAGFESSLWVGGVTFVLCAAAVAIVVLWTTKTGQRLAFLGVLAIAAIASLVLVLPLLKEQIASAAGRGGGSPILLSPFPVLGTSLDDGTRRLLDLPTYWLVLLTVEFCAAWILGAIGVFGLRRTVDDTRMLTALSVAAFVSLCGGWLLVSTAGENNDLGWRAVLPGLLILMSIAGAFASRYRATSIIAVVLLASSLPAGFELIRGNAAGRLSADGARFRDAPAMWAAVRKHSAPDERIASNPNMTRELAPWPIALSWALLSDRRSCFAGNELTFAFAPLSSELRAQASGLFARVFAGNGSDADLHSLVTDFGCRVVLLTRQDGAWTRDAFSTSDRFSRVEETSDFRIYPSGFAEWHPPYKLNLPQK